MNLFERLSLMLSTKRIIKTLLFIAVCNIPLVSGIISLVVGESKFKVPGCHYINGSGKFRQMSYRGLKEGSHFKYSNGYEDAETNLRIYRLENPDDTTILYRRFSINPLKFWRYWEYLTCECYNLPFMNDLKAERLIEQVNKREWEEYQIKIERANRKESERIAEADTAFLE